MPAKRRTPKNDGVPPEAPEAPAVDTTASPPPHRVKGTPQRRWYVVHTYSGYENKVRLQMEARIKTMHVEDRIFQVLVPIEEVTEIRNGERRNVRRNVFPGYVLVDMVLDDESWHCVRGTPGVTNFVGSSITEPIPLQEGEIDVILRQMKQSSEDAKAPPVMPKFQIGQSVKIIEGPFAESIGQVSEIHPERSKLTVLITIFNRETPVELDYLQVEKA